MQYEVGGEIFVFPLFWWTLQTFLPSNYGAWFSCIFITGESLLCSLSLSLASSFTWSIVSASFCFLMLFDPFLLFWACENMHVEDIPSILFHHYTFQLPFNHPYYLSLKSKDFGVFLRLPRWLWSYLGANHFWLTWLIPTSGIISWPRCFYRALS